MELNQIGYRRPLCPEHMKRPRGNEFQFLFFHDEPLHQDQLVLRECVCLTISHSSEKEIWAIKFQAAYFCALTAYSLSLLLHLPLCGTTILSVQCIALDVCVFQTMLQRARWCAVGILPVVHLWIIAKLEDCRSPHSCRPSNLCDSARLRVVQRPFLASSGQADSSEAELPPSLTLFRGDGRL